jgi:hypothetical protein
MRKVISQTFIYFATTVGVFFRGADVMFVSAAENNARRDGNATGAMKLNDRGPIDV